MSKIPDHDETPERIKIRRAIKQTAASAETITISEVRSEVAVSCDVAPSLVTDEIELLKKYGEIYTLPSEAGPEVRRP